MARIHFPSTLPKISRFPISIEVPHSEPVNPVVERHPCLDKYMGTAFSNYNPNAHT